MRKLASIRKIVEIRGIANADAIECALVDGWMVVVKKNEYQVGDFAIYCEVDSWIPTELAPFLSKGKEPREFNGVRGERLRTVKLRGQLSQGLLLPLDAKWIITNLGAGPGAKFSDYEGIDLSEKLGIQKWEAPIPAQLAGQVRGSFPGQVPKTDEERVQNLVSSWRELANLDYEVTEKLEGSSMTVGMIDGEFYVCSRNLSLKETQGNTFWSLARSFDIENKMKLYGFDNLVLQGELVGEGVQGNHYAICGHDFYVFSVYDIVSGQYFAPHKRRELVQKLGLKHVPVIAESMNLFDQTPETVLLLANGQSQINPKVLREGLVFKQTNGQQHWKAVSNEYLLKHG